MKGFFGINCSAIKYEMQMSALRDRWSEKVLHGDSSGAPYKKPQRQEEEL